MAEPSLKQQFLRLLRDVMHRNGVRQKDLVQHLEVSASAMSQMLNGAMMPSQKRLDQMLEFLHPDLAEAEALQQMLYWLRAGRRRMPSGTNRRLFMLRCRSGISISRLAELSGISEVRLRRLESAATSQLSFDDAIVLAGVLGCSVGELTGEEVYEASASLPAEVAEADTLSLPRIRLAELTEYNAGEHIGNFAFDRAGEFVERCLLSASAAAVVGASAAELNAALPGEFSLTLGDRKPEDFLPLELCRNAKGNFFIRGGGSGVFGIPDGGAEAIWAIPLLEICYIPKN